MSLSLCFGSNYRTGKEHLTLKSKHGKPAYIYIERAKFKSNGFQMFIEVLLTMGKKLIRIHLESARVLNSDQLQ